MALSILQNHHVRGRLALFVGADLPLALSGVPSRRELASTLAMKHGLEAHLSLAQVATRLAPGGYRFAIIDEVNHAFDTSGLSPQPIHYHIARLSAPWTITTAYDDLLSQAFHTVRPDWSSSNHLVRGNGLSFRNPRQPTLLQLYGLVGQPDTLVLTEDDHFELLSNPEKIPLLERVRNVFEEYAVLFVGFELSDPDFRLLWSQMLSRMGHFMVGAWVIASRVKGDEAQVWADRQVRLIEAEPLEVLEMLEGIRPLVLPSPRPVEEANLPDNRVLQPMADLKEETRPVSTEVEPVVPQSMTTSYSSSMPPPNATQPKKLLALVMIFTLPIVLLVATFATATVILPARTNLVLVFGAALIATVLLIVAVLSTAGVLAPEQTKELISKIINILPKLGGNSKGNSDDSQ